MPIRIRTGALAGIAGQAVSVEVVINRGLPGYHLVGLPGAEVRESRERVLAALRHCGAKVPPGRITVNLAPAGIRKSGASFDLAIAVGIAAAAEGWSADGATSGRLRAVFFGELSLFGEVRSVRGLLPLLLDVGRPSAGARTCAVVPAAQGAEAALAPGLRVVPVRDLREALDWCRAGREPDPVPARATPTGAGDNGAIVAAAHAACCEIGRLTGQELARKAAVVAATGRHNLLLVGPPGAGKTRLCRLLADLQPPLTPEEAIAVTRIQSAAGLLSASACATRRPFRAPHHTVTAAGLVGGGPGLRPGEATLAHGGLLFLDELAEFQPAVLDVLRQPLQDGHVTVSRGPGQRRFPAAFQLLAASNPCRCGHFGSRTRTCRCAPRDRSRYLSRVPGPLLDRIEVFAAMAEWKGSFTPGAPPPVGGGWRTSPQVADLESARARLTAWARTGGAPAASGADRFLDHARGAFGLSLRAVVRCRQVAATVAALDECTHVEPEHIQEALEFRREATVTPET
ncbi:MAG: YifB family Mg chelatase-like AAA ATPase [bacterium]|nr:YifB family Mg chelatase-like AAA ATPase [bacterium]